MVSQRLGHFEILEKLGAGGMGEVYKARDSRLDRIVAIKVLPPEFTRDGVAVQRRQREARMVASPPRTARASTTRNTTAMPSFGACR